MNWWYLGLMGPAVVVITFGLHWLRRHDFDPRKGQEPLSQYYVPFEAVNTDRRHGLRLSLVVMIINLLLVPVRAGGSGWPLLENIVCTAVTFVYWLRQPPRQIIYQFTLPR